MIDAKIDAGDNGESISRRFIEIVVTVGPDELAVTSAPAAYGSLQIQPQCFPNEEEIPCPTWSLNILRPTTCSLNRS